MHSYFLLYFSLLSHLHHTYHTPTHTVHISLRLPPSLLSAIFLVYSIFICCGVITICDLYYVSFISRSFSFEFPETKNHVREKKDPVYYLSHETDRSPIRFGRKLLLSQNIFALSSLLSGRLLFRILLVYNIHIHFSYCST